MEKQVLLTHERLAQLEQELEDLKTVKRKEVAEKIKQALSFGDLSENSEYDEAKNEQALVEARVLQIESILKQADVIDEDSIRTDVVGIGSKVKLLDIEYDEELSYTIVGAAEADTTKKKLSFESPVGSAIMNKVVGDIVEAKTPSGIVKFKVLGIGK